MGETIQNPAEGAVAPAAPPRGVTRAVARRAWGEPRVRAWWVGAVGMAAVCGWFGVGQADHWNEGRRLIAEGAVVEAKVVDAGGLEMAVQKAAKDDPVRLEYEYGGRTYTVSGYLEGNEEPIVPRSTVRIRVDRHDPTIWTYRTRPTSLAGELVAGVVLAPITAAVAAGAVVARNRVLRTWARSPAKAAVVVDVGRSALAPSSLALRCAYPGARDRTLYTVFAPATVKVGKGDAIYLLPPFKNKGPTLAAAAFQ